MKKFDYQNYLLNSPIIKGEGVYLFTKNKKKYFDGTGGLTGTITLGWGNKKIENAIFNQLKKIAHIDFKSLKDENRDVLRKLLLTDKKHKLDEIYYAGNSGAEANEGAMKLSYQYHQANGKKNKKWFISRYQSFHGSSSETVAIGDKFNLRFFKDFNPKFRAKVKEHNLYRYKNINESEKDYSNRSIDEIEKKIRKIGPENISGFVAETMMGGLVGDVPACDGYWKKLRSICNKYDIHLICDEIWCGAGTSGKLYCVDHENITPDFITFGKTLTSGYLPLSIIITRSKFLKKIKKKFNLIRLPSSTYQGHSLGVVAATECMKIINNKDFLKSVSSKGKYFRSVINNELKNNEFFYNVRGRGMRNSVEHNTPNNDLFSEELQKNALDKYNLILGAKWHRTCFSGAINISYKNLNRLIEQYLNTFLYTQKKWKKKRII